VREIAYSEIGLAVEWLWIRARTWLPPDIAMGIECAADSEEREPVRLELINLLERFQTVTQESGEIGSPVLFADVGDAVTIVDGTIEAVRRAGMGYGIEPTMHTRQVPGDQIALRLMFHTARRIESSGVVNQAALVEFVKQAEIAAVAPVIVAMGLGDTIAESAVLADYALARPIDRRNPESGCAAAERQIKTATDALAVNIEGQINPVDGNACVLYISPPCLRRASCTI